MAFSRGFRLSTEFFVFLILKFIVSQIHAEKIHRFVPYMDTGLNWFWDYILIYILNIYLFVLMYMNNIYEHTIRMYLSNFILLPFFSFLSRQVNVTRYFLSSTFFVYLVKLCIESADFLKSHPIKFLNFFSLRSIRKSCIDDDSLNILKQQTTSRISTRFLLFYFENKINCVWMEV